MMSRVTVLAGALLLVMLIVPTSLTPAVVASPQDLERKVREVYIELADAERKGANVTQAASKLNEALGKIDEADVLGNQTQSAVLLGQAEWITNEVEASIPGLVAVGESAARNRFILVAATSLALVLGGLLAYVFGGKVLK